MSSAKVCEDPHRLSYAQSKMYDCTTNNKRVNVSDAVSHFQVCNAVCSHLKSDLSMFAQNVRIKAHFEKQTTYGRLFVKFNWQWHSPRSEFDWVRTSTLIVSSPVGMKPLGISSLLKWACMDNGSEVTWWSCKLPIRNRHLAYLKNNRSKLFTLSKDKTN